MESSRSATTCGFLADGRFVPHERRRSAPLGRPPARRAGRARASHECERAGRLRGGAGDAGGVRPDRRGAGRQVGRARARAPARRQAADLQGARRAPGRVLAAVPDRALCRLVRGHHLRPAARARCPCPRRPETSCRRPMAEGAARGRGGSTARLVGGDGRARGVRGRAPRGIRQAGDRPRTRDPVRRERGAALGEPAAADGRPPRVGPDGRHDPHRARRRRRRRGRWWSCRPAMPTACPRPGTPGRSAGRTPRRQRRDRGADPASGLGAPPADAEAGTVTAARRRLRCN